MAGESKTAKRKRTTPEARKSVESFKGEPGKPPVERRNAKFNPEAARPETANSKAAPLAAQALSVSPDSYDSSDNGPDEEFESLVRVLRQNRRRLLRLPGVVAVDVGYKIEDGVFLNELALRIHVERKLPEKYFREHQGQLVSKGKGFKPLPRTSYFDPDGKLGTFDVIEAKYCPTSLGPPRRGAVLETPLDPDKINRRRRINPLVGGISIGSPDSPFGTLGALVWDKTDGTVCILSNWHVLAGHPQAEPGTPCLQPGTFDRGRRTDVVAQLKRWSFDCQTDAAIAELNGSRHYCAGSIIGFSKPIVEAANPHLGMKVFKSGRSTGMTPGFVDGLYFSTAIEYSNGAVQIFEDQIHIAPVDPNDRISETGDSGAIWVADANGQGYLAVGLHFGGDQLRSAFGEYALANPMTIVEERLNFSFRPVFLEIRDEDVASLSPVSRIEFGNGNGSRRNEGGVTTTGIQAGDQIPIPPSGKTP